jgi:hypothetical protein
MKNQEKTKQGKMGSEGKVQRWRRGKKKIKEVSRAVLERNSR